MSVPEAIRFKFRDWTPAILALPPQRQPAEVIFQDNFDSLDDAEENFNNDNEAADMADAELNEQVDVAL
jgi:hypothetical protein